MRAGQVDEQVREFDFIPTADLIDALFDRADDLILYFAKDGEPNGTFSIKGDTVALSVIEEALRRTLEDWRTVSEDADGALAVFAEHLDDLSE